MNKPVIGDRVKIVNHAVYPELKGKMATVESTTLGCLWVYVDGIDYSSPELEHIHRGRGYGHQVEYNEFEIV